MVIYDTLPSQTFTDRRAADRRTVAQNVAFRGLMINVAMFAIGIACAAVAFYK